MKLRHLLFSVVAVGGVAVAAPSFSDNNIAFVNVQQIMHDSTAAKSAKDQIDAKTKSYQDVMSKKEQTLHDEEQDLAKQKSVLSPDAFDKKVKDFRAQATTVEKDVQTKRYELESAEANAGHEIEKAVFDIVSKLAKDRGYTVVLPSSALLYADTKLDITQDVLAKLNATLPKVTVKFKAGASSDQ